MGRVRGAKQKSEKYEVKILGPAGSDVLFTKRYKTVADIHNDFPYWHDGTIRRFIKGVTPQPNGFHMSALENSVLEADDDK